ncbi:MAG: molybdenum cofactor biosynthesis protein MoaE [Candidatus Bathyarchaeia archaeon]
MEDSGVVEKRRFNILREMQEFTKRNTQGRSGGILFYTGVVREERGVVKLSIETNKPATEEALREIARRNKEKFRLHDVLIIQAEGDFRPGDVVALVALSGLGRREIFAALKEVTDAARALPTIVKRESYSKE